MRACVLLIALLAAGCASVSDQSASSPQRPAPSALKRPGTDTLCLNDCLGSGASKALCEDRCSY